MKRKPLLASALALGCIAVGAASLLNQPVFAIDPDSKAPFVDKEFEAAIVKHFEKRFFNLIEASDEQKQQITALIDTLRENARPQREKMRSEALELNQMMSGNASDEELRNKVKELRSVRDKLMDERMETALKVRALLKPEQRKAVSDRISAFLSGERHMRMLR